MFQCPLFNIFEKSFQSGRICFEVFHPGARKEHLGRITLPPPDDDDRRDRPLDASSSWYRVFSRRRIVHCLGSHLYRGDSEEGGGLRTRLYKFSLPDLELELPMPTPDEVISSIHDEFGDIPSDLNFDRVNTFFSHHATLRYATQPTIVT